MHLICLIFLCYSVIIKYQVNSWPLPCFHYMLRQCWQKLQFFSLSLLFSNNTYSSVLFSLPHNILANSIKLANLWNVVLSVRPFLPQGVWLTNNNNKLNIISQVRTEKNNVYADLTHISRGMITVKIHSYWIFLLNHIVYP